MLSTVTLAASPEFAVRTWRCRPPDVGCSPIERPIQARLVLVRAGRFRRRGSDGWTDLDQTVGYLATAGEEEQFAHPHGGDVCTSVQLTSSAWGQLAGEPDSVFSETFYVDARTELAHRRMLAVGSTDVDYRLAEELLRLLAAALRANRRMPARDAPGPFDARLVERARAAIHDGHPAARGLFPLAEFVGASPYRLSRAFPLHLGVSLTKYRNRFRVGRAFDALERDESNLADIAASLGFSDQAHFTRVMRAQVGWTPTAVQRALRERPTD
ncbi:helix-turn-helix domain-containing protein [Mycobacterium sp. MMS18-G62]